MKTIPVDYNAITESDQLRLSFPSSRREMLAARTQDWAWLSDGEVIVGARIAIDDEFGVVGIPDWQTIVHLDGNQAQDLPSIRREVRGLVQNPHPSTEQEWRLFQLLTIYESIAPSDAEPSFRVGYFECRRAATLLSLGKPELALVEIEEARRINPGQAIGDCLFLRILRVTDLPRAVREAEVLAAKPDLSANVLAHCICILGTLADTVPDHEFTPLSLRIIAWVERFRNAPSDQSVKPSKAMVQFDYGLVLLRLGRHAEARQVFVELASEINPAPEFIEAARLTTYDDDARRLAAQFRSRPSAA